MVVLFVRLFFMMIERYDVVTDNATRAILLLQELPTLVQLCTVSDIFEEHLIYFFSGRDWIIISHGACSRVIRIIERLSLASFEERCSNGGRG